MSEHGHTTMISQQQHHHHLHHPSSSSFTSSPAPSDRRDQPKSFVFIDEQNRHKRLKVVKACDGCRKRKIKCDAATTNAWPCGSCTRLKIQCAPPAPDPADVFNYDADLQAVYAYPSHTPSWDYPDTPTSQYAHQANPGSYTSVPTLLQRGPSYDYAAAGYTYNPLAANQLPDHDRPRSQASSHFHPEYVSEVSEQAPIPRRNDSSTSVKSEGSDQGLHEHMGDLQISGTGYAPYLIKSRDAEQPALAEEDIELPKLTRHGSRVQIPEEMMPTDEQAQRYFTFFFDNIHPYVPALYPPTLYKHWRFNKHTMSPLVLEAIFACSTRMMGEPVEGARWLALAKKHEESFRDTPRLSTLQGLLILLKARETMPTRGYYYRSWMSIVNMVAMAKDLSLHEHHEQHQNGGSCGATKYDCLAKSRVWHCLYLLEIFVGGPQGRTDFGVSTDTVDFDCAYPQLDPGDPESKISEQFCQIMRAIQNVRQSLAIYASLKKDKRDDWAFDSEFLKLNHDYQQWQYQLPQHLRIQYPSDGAVPKVPFHFAANLQAYWNLSLILHHRPQLQCLTDPLSESWRESMLTCYSAAKRLCCLQEALLNQYGLNGMMFMQRGINFTIYVVLTCTMLHLVAVTHPHPDIYTGATSFFTRHMRILELCASSWPMPEIEAQILSLRQAFSADINQPFELKPDFPGTPSKSSESPRSDSSNSHKASTTFNQPMLADANRPSQSPPTPPQVPPNMAYAHDEGYPTPESLAIMGFDQTQYSTDVVTPTMQYSNQPQQWNPTPIITNFETMIGLPGSASSVHSASPTHPQSMTPDSYFPPTSSQQLDSRYAAYSQPPTSNPTYSPHESSMPQMPGSYPHSQPQQQQAYYEQSQLQPGYISPNMWHEAVVTAFGGTKRRWNGSASSQGSKRMR